MLDIGSPFAGMRVRWLACYRLVPRLCCSAASLAVNMLIRCSKFSEQISWSLNNSWDALAIAIFLGAAASLGFGQPANNSAASTYKTNCVSCHGQDDRGQLRGQE